jgi:class 3 adenylate cyclase
METRTDHRLGQYRAELFDELLSLCLSHAFEGAPIERNRLLAASGAEGVPLRSSVDFVVRKPNGQLVLLKAKAPYAGSVASDIQRSLRQVRSYLDVVDDPKRVASVVLALASDVPDAVIPEIEAVRNVFAERGIPFEVWDETYIRETLARRAGVELADLSIPGLETALGRPSPTGSGMPGLESLVAAPPFGAQHELAGTNRDVLVICADFCSYSRFVHASAGETDLVTSIMGRFYRGTRHVVAEFGGMLDKFMGDGLLAYWIPPDGASENVLASIRALVGLAGKLAVEWQDRVDLSVEPKGMRVGAAVGPVLFIPENPDESGPVQAVGECLNLASRLQGLAQPNSLVVSNRLKSRCFGRDDAFVELPPTAVKNIGDIVAWQRDMHSLVT